MALSARWFKDCKSSEEKKKREETIRAANHVIELIREILEGELKSKLSSSEADYESPSWAYWQADKNGQVKALRTTLKLLDLDKKGE